MTGATLVQSKKLKLSRRISEWSRGINVERRIAILFLLLGSVSGLMTYLLLAKVWGTEFSEEEQARAITWLLLADFIVVLSLGTIIARRVVVLWLERRRGLLGAKLHSRLILLFGLIALIPAITVAIISSSFLNYTFDIWFSGEVKRGMESSRNIAGAYEEEQRQRIANDTLSIANEIRSQNWGGVVDFSAAQRVPGARDRLLRDLSEAVVIDRSRRILASGGFTLMMEFDLELPDGALATADGGEPALFENSSKDRRRALVALDPQAGLYLYTGRVVDESMLDAIESHQVHGRAL